MSGGNTGAVAQELSDSWEKNKSVEKSDFVCFSASAYRPVGSGSPMAQKASHEGIKGVHLCNLSNLKSPPKKEKKERRLCVFRRHPVENKTM